MKISQNHKDVSGGKNPRASKVYVYSLSGDLLDIYDTINSFSDKYGLNKSSMRTLLNRSDLKPVINSSIICSLNEHNKDDILNFIDSKYIIIDGHVFNKNARVKYKMVCEYCGKEYTLTRSMFNYDPAATRHYCYECSKSGVISRGVVHSNEHNNNISKSAIGRK